MPDADTQMSQSCQIYGPCSCRLRIQEILLQYTRNQGYVCRAPRAACRTESHARHLEIQKPRQATIGGALQEEKWGTEMDNGSIVEPFVCSLLWGLLAPSAASQSSCHAAFQPRTITGWTSCIATFYCSLAVEAVEAFNQSRIRARLPHSSPGSGNAPTDSTHPYSNTCPTHGLPVTRHWRYHVSCAFGTAAVRK